MGLNDAHGNMYTDIDKTLTILQGSESGIDYESIVELIKGSKPIPNPCPHACAYCSTVELMKRHPNVARAYSGPFRLCDADLKRDLGGTPKTIFVVNTLDLFAKGVPSAIVIDLLIYLKRSQINTYMFQTKDPMNMLKFMTYFPINVIVGTTIETDDAAYLKTISKAPSPEERARGICTASMLLECESFVTIEPIMDFTVDGMTELIRIASPDYVYIGANSKSRAYKEPTYEKAMQLVDAIKGLGITVKKKENLDFLRTMGRLD